MLINKLHFLSRKKMLSKYDSYIRLSVVDLLRDWKLFTAHVIFFCFLCFFFNIGGFFIFFVFFFFLIKYPFIKKQRLIFLVLGLI